MLAPQAGKTWSNPYEARPQCPHRLRTFLWSRLGGRAALLDHIADRLTGTDLTPRATHKALGRLPFTNIWTTNFDDLLESAMPSYQVIVREDELAGKVSGTQPKILKIHGSLDAQGWAVGAEAVITRQDFESYQLEHPRMWSLLQATYLTQTFVFLGFSLTDPNIEVLLRLMRSLGKSGPPQHYAIMKAPKDDAELKSVEHFVRDLENSGIQVVHLNAWRDLAPLLEQLVRQTRPPSLFIAGSGDDNKIRPYAEAMADRLADDENVAISSYAGPSAVILLTNFGHRLLNEGKYRPDRIITHYRQTISNDPPPDFPERIGTIVFGGSTDKDKLRREAIDQWRAVLVIGGSRGTQIELDIAEDLSVPVIPLPGSGGAALAGFNKGVPAWVDTIGNRDDWILLEHPNVRQACASAARLVRGAMRLAM